MRFDKTFEVAGTPDEVIALFADPALMASFLPGAAVGERNDDGSYPATLTVAFGPKRIAFKGKLRNEIDPASQSGKVTGSASTDLRGAKMSATMRYELAAAPAGTRVTLVSQTEMTGMLAEFARTGGAVLTDALISQFADAFSAHVEGQRAPLAAPAPPAPAALSVFALLLQLIRSALGFKRPFRP